MFRVTPRRGPIPTLELADEAAGSLAVLAPERGGMVTRFSAKGREILYLDRATLEDRAANVRGGIPVLFPSPGRLTGDAYAWGNARGAMKQHGFARNLPWEIAATSEAGAAEATLKLRSSEATRAQFPWDFTLEHTYTLRGATLAIAIRVANESSSPMPFGVGFHPYFAVPDAAKGAARIPTEATRAFDNTQKREVPFAGFDFSLPEVDLHLHDHGSSAATLELGSVCVALRGSPELGHWVVWALRGRDFICLEPWSCPGDALNTGNRLIVLAPGEERSLTLSIACS